MDILIFATSSFKNFFVCVVLLSLICWAVGNFALVRINIIRGENKNDNKTVSRADRTAE